MYALCTCMYVCVNILSMYHHPLHSHLIREWWWQVTSYADTHSFRPMSLPLPVQSTRSSTQSGIGILDDLSTHISYYSNTAVHKLYTHILQLRTGNVLWFCECLSTYWMAHRYRLQMSHAIFWLSNYATVCRFIWSFHEIQLLMTPFDYSNTMEIWISASGTKSRFYSRNDRFLNFWIQKWSFSDTNPWGTTAVHLFEYCFKDHRILLNINH